VRSDSLRPAQAESGVVCCDADRGVWEVTVEDELEKADELLRVEAVQLEREPVRRLLGGAFGQNSTLQLADERVRHRLEALGVAALIRSCRDTTAAVNTRAPVLSTGIGG
jgi:hypothetical protein